MSRSLWVLVAGVLLACHAEPPSTIEPAPSRTNGEIVVAPRVVSPENPAVVAAGVDFACFVMDGGRVKCLGKNDRGQLGLGNTTAVPVDETLVDDRLPFVDLGSVDAVSVAAGGRTACALLADRTAKCWGANESGQLGNGSANHRGDAAGEMGAALPALRAPDLNDIHALAVGEAHVCAITALRGGSTRSVRCWGANAFGQLGAGTTQPLGDAPTETTGSTIGFGTRVPSSIAAGDAHTCVTFADGGLKCWGRNDFSQLGLTASAPWGDGAGEMAALPDVNLAGETALRVTAGGARTCVEVASSGTPPVTRIKCWGKQDELNVVGIGRRGNRGSAVVCGAGCAAPCSTTCTEGVAESATCYAPQPDDPSVGTPSTEVSSDYSLIRLASGQQRYAKLAMSGTHGCALFDTGDIKCWGGNGSGQLGLASRGNAIGALQTNARGDDFCEMGDRLPAVELGPGELADDVAVGSEFTCARLRSGRVKCWGRRLGTSVLDCAGDSCAGDAPNEMGLSLLPLDLGSRGVVGAAAAQFTTCAVLRGGDVSCWGRNNLGQLGLASVPVGTIQPTPLTAVALGGRASRVVSGTNHTCALEHGATEPAPGADGFVKCWGGNLYGQLGLGDTSDRLVPSSRIAWENGNAFQTNALATRGNHTCALTGPASSRRVACWGRNGFGQLGLGNATNRARPVTTVDLGTGFENVAEVVAGADHTCARSAATSQVKCWGNNTFGQLGIGNTQHRGDGANELGSLLPAVPLGAGRTARALSAGGNHTCALLDNGEVRCWGGNNFGQLGTGDTQARGDQPSDVLVPALSGADLVAAGEFHTCGRNASSKEVKCWGRNDNGQLGTPPGSDVTNPATQPVTALGLGASLFAKALFASGLHTCAILNSNQLHCWGYNFYGALGDATPVGATSGPKSTPVNVGPEPTPALSYVTTWIGNTYARDAGNPPNPKGIQTQLESLTVLRTGANDRLLTHAYWSEAGDEATLFSNDLVPETFVPGVHHRGGFAVAANANHVFLGTRALDTCPDGSHSAWGVTRRLRSDPAQWAPFSGGAICQEGAFRLLHTTLYTPPDVDSLTGRKSITHLAANGTHLFVSDPHVGDLPTQNIPGIAIFDASSLVRLRTIAMAQPGALAAAPDGSLWAVERTAPGSVVRHFDPATGATLPGAIAVADATALAFRPQPTPGAVPRLAVADAANHQILFYDLTSSGPVLSSQRLGVQGGVYAAPNPGRAAPDRLLAPTMLDYDSQGNLFVGTKALGPDIRKFDTSLKLVKSVKAPYLTEALAIADPATSGTTFYSAHARYGFDYTKSDGREWSWEAALVNPATANRYDPRLVAGGPTVPFGVKTIAGHKYLFTTNGMFPSQFAVSRFEGELAVPVTWVADAAPHFVEGPLWTRVVECQPDPHPDHQRRWVWRAGSSGGVCSGTDTFTEIGSTRFPHGLDMDVDAAGNVWNAAAGNLLRFDNTNAPSPTVPCTRKEPSVPNSPCEPRYSFDRVSCWTLSGMTSPPCAPAPFKSVHRAKYVQANDRLYVTGFTPEHPWVPGTLDLYAGGTEVACYESISTAARRIKWRTRLPYHQGTTHGSINAIAVAGTRLFAAMRASSGTESIYVFDTETGAFRGELTPGPEVGRATGWVDAFAGLSAHLRSNLETVVSVHDVTHGRIIVYRVAGN